MRNKIGFGWNLGRVHGKLWHWDATIYISKARKFALNFTLSGHTEFVGLGVFVSKSDIMFSVGLVHFRIHWLYAK